jgi:hypothetical protein
MACTTKLPRLQTAELLARIIGWNDIPVITSDILSVSYTAFILEEATGEENVVDGYEDVALTPVADYVEPSLLKNTKWTEDAVGYNFHFIPAADIFAERGQLYGIRVTFETTEEPLVSVFLIEVV